MLTVKHLRALLARPECRDDMPVVLTASDGVTIIAEPVAVRIDLDDQLVITAE